MKKFLGIFFIFFVLFTTSVVNAGEVTVGTPALYPTEEIDTLFYDNNAINTSVKKINLPEVQKNQKSKKVRIKKENSLKTQKDVNVKKEEKQNVSPVTQKKSEQKVDEVKPIKQEKTEK